MLRLSHITAAGLVLIGLSANLSAEEINMPAVTIETTSEAAAIPTPETAVTPVPETTEYSIQLPGRGMTMEAVQNRFGEAIEKFPAVGEPPITRWVYNNFSVYFESEYVIHAVVNN